MMYLGFSSLVFAECRQVNSLHCEKKYGIALPHADTKTELSIALDCFV